MEIGLELPPVYFREVLGNRSDVLLEVLDDIQAANDGARPRMVELGVYDAINAAYILSNVPNLEYVGVDLWESSETLQCEACTQDYMDILHNQAWDTLRRYPC